VYVLPQTPVSCLILHALGTAGEPLSTDALARAVRRERASVAAAMTRLQAQGLVVRCTQRGEWSLGHHRDLRAEVVALLGGRPVTVASLARRLGVPNPAVRRVLRDLEKAGHATRLTTVGPWRVREEGDPDVPPYADWWEEDPASRRWYPTPVACPKTQHMSR
jgi:DNA-binding IclR family transcriptional regulator